MASSATDKQQQKRKQINQWVTKFSNFDAKSDEILSIFTGGPIVDIDGFVDKLSRLSPSNSSKWVNIK